MKAGGALGQLFALAALCAAVFAAWTRFGSLAAGLLGQSFCG